MQEKIAVIGGGGWGTALGNLLCDNGFVVTVYALEEEVVSGINENRENPLFLKGVMLNNKLKSDLMGNFTGAEKYVVWAVPTQFSRKTAENMKKNLNNSSILIATKGIEINTGELIIEIMKDVLDAKFTILSGPSFAKEVAQKSPTAVSIASDNLGEATLWQKKLSNDYFRAYTSDDVIGVEVGGAMKNVIAVATGISDGLGLGHNARAGIITRGLAEITRLGVLMGGKRETFMGLSGMGDLVLTCTGDLSRNRTVGIQIGKGVPVNEILSGMKMVAEGLFTAKAAMSLSDRFNLELPITQEVYEVVYNGKNPKDSLLDLMKRPLKKESE